MADDVKPGDFVIHEDRPEWGVGRVMAVQGSKVRVSFQHAGSKVLKGAPLRAALESEITREGARPRRRAAASNCANHAAHPDRYLFCPYCGEDLRRVPPRLLAVALIDAGMMEIYQYCKDQFPRHIAFIQSGSWWEVFEDDAHFCNRFFQWKLGGKGNLTMTGVPMHHSGFDRRLQAAGQPHLFVTQLGFGRQGDRVSRAITEVWPE